MGLPTPELRDKQVEQLAFYIGKKKSLDLSDPGTGKTPPCCVFAYYMWDRKQAKTIWTMPKSLLKKNKKEMERFTDFTDKDVVILETDHAPLPKKDWTGPTITRMKKIRAWDIQVGDVRTNTYLYGKDVQKAYGNKPFRLVYEADGKRYLFGKPNPVGSQQGDIVVKALLGPDKKPRKVKGFQVPEQVRDLIAEAAHAKVFICTFAFMAEHWERLIKTIPELDLLLVDELHMPGGYSTTGTKATDSFFFMNKHVKHFVGMTGTLINGRLDSAFPAIHVIEPRYYGSEMGFRMEHASVIDEYDRVLVWKNQGKLKQILARHSIQRTFEEVYGKEDVAFFTEYVEVPDDLRESYDQFHDQAMLELEDGRVLDGTLAGVALIRARQILAHPETMGLGSDSGWTAKDDRLAVHLAEGKKTLIFAALKPEQERILRLCKDLGLRAALINSDVSAKQRAAIDEMAQKGELDVIVGSGPTVAVGYNWEMFDVVIFASIDYMDTNILQAYRRANRGGRTSTLRVVFLQYDDTIDQKQYKIVREKSVLANSVDSNRKVLEFTESRPL